MSKRANKRYIRRLETEFTAAGKTYKAISGDFSLSGIFIRTNHASPPGTEIDIVIHLPDGNDAVLNGIVRRAMKTFAVSLKNGMGIEITASDTNYETFLKTYTDKQKPLQSSQDDDPGHALSERTVISAARSGSPAFMRDCIAVRCPDCGTKNRVRKDSIGLTIKCGKCLTPLKVD